MTGPLDVLTTSRSGERAELILRPASPPEAAFADCCAAASVAACCARASGDHVVPVITAAAPIAALRMRNARRSMPEGMLIGPAETGSNSSSLLVLVIDASSG